MTSSLVGSEMCIRDSSLSIPCCRPAGGQSPSVVPNWVEANFRHAAFAVSYTHLTLPTICSV
eukprot:1730257-Prorocentrum_lima.AAC.1